LPLPFIPLRVLRFFAALGSSPMNHFLHGVTRAIAESFDLPEPIVEIGSYQVPGQENIANLRDLFPGKQYLGMDMRAGPGVDLVANVEKLPQQSGSVGTIFALNTFEHVRCFWRGFEEIHRVLRPDGVLVVSCPFFFRIHNHPDDYWRFTPSAFEALLESYPSKVIGWHGARHRPANVWAVAQREKRPPISAAQFARYQELLGRYAHEPRLSWHERLRCRLAALLCGRTRLAPYLDHDRWETVCRNAVQNDGSEASTATPLLNTSTGPSTRHAA
jgi:SAM-dependent methyltransferase